MQYRKKYKYNLNIIAGIIKIAGNENNTKNKDIKDNKI